MLLSQTTSYLFVSNCKETDLNPGQITLLMKGTESNKTVDPSPTPTHAALKPFFNAAKIILRVVVFCKTYSKIRKTNFRKNNFLRKHFTIFFLKQSCHPSTTLFFLCLIHFLIL